MPEYQPTPLPEGSDIIEITGSAWAADINRIRTEAGEPESRVANAEVAREMARDEDERRSDADGTDSGAVNPVETL